MYIQGKQWVASESASNWLRFGNTEEKDVPCLFRIYIQYVFAYEIILNAWNYKSLLVDQKDVY